MLSSVKDREILKNALIEISNSMTRIAGEREFIKEAISEVSEKLDIDKKLIKSLSTIYYKQNMTEIEQNYEEISELYDILNTTKKTDES